jgi:apolipoprotein N-acyltransferase
MTDTPPAAPTFPPPSTLEQVKSLVGDLARPFAIYVVAAATAWSILGGQTADKVGAAGLILAALYGAKAAETWQQNKTGAQVEIAKAQAGTGQ